MLSNDIGLKRLEPTVELKTQVPIDKYTIVDIVDHEIFKNISQIIYSLNELEEKLASISVNSVETGPQLIDESVQKGSTLGSLGSPLAVRLKQAAAELCNINIRLHSITNRIDL